MGFIFFWDALYNDVNQPIDRMKRRGIGSRGVSQSISISNFATQTSFLWVTAGYVCYLLVYASLPPSKTSYANFTRHARYAKKGTR